MGTHVGATCRNQKHHLPLYNLSQPKNPLKNHTASYAIVTNTSKANVSTTDVVSATRWPLDTKSWTAQNSQAEDQC